MEFCLFVLTLKSAWPVLYVLWWRIVCIHGQGGLIARFELVGKELFVSHLVIGVGKCALLRLFIDVVRHGSSRSRFHPANGYMSSPTTKA